MSSCLRRTARGNQCTRRAAAGSQLLPASNRATSAAGVRLPEPPPAPQRPPSALNVPVPAPGATCSVRPCRKKRHQQLLAAFAKHLAHLRPSQPQGRCQAGTAHGLLHGSGQLPAASLRSPPPLMGASVHSGAQSNQEGLLPLPSSPPCTEGRVPNFTTIVSFTCTRERCVSFCTSARTSHCPAPQHKRSHYCVLHLSKCDLHLSTWTLSLRK
jgi:hypothetical protein